MKVIVCFARAFIFFIAYSSCTRFELDETEREVQVMEKIIEDIKEVVPPYIPNENSPRPYLEENIMIERISKRVELLSIA